MRKYSKEQLTRKYAECMESNGTTNYFECVLVNYLMSSSPSQTLTADVREMNRQTQKEFVLWLVDAHESGTLHGDINESQRTMRKMITLTLNAMN